MESDTSKFSILENNQASVTDRSSLDSTVSVVIPAKNEQDNIERVITALFNQDYPENRVDIHVVDNLSTDQTVEKVRRYASVAVHESAGNIGQLRNIGINSSDGDFVAFIDADCIAPPSWLSRSVELLKSDPDTAIVGSILKVEDENCAPWIERYWIADHRSRYQEELTDVRTISSFCFCARRETLVEEGGFNDLLKTCEDQELGYRVTSSGKKILIDKSIEIIHLGNAKTLSRFFLRQLWQGGSNIQNTLGRKFDFRETGSLAAPALFILFLALAPLLLLFGHPSMASGMLILALLVSLAVTLKKMPTRNLGELPGYFLIWSTYLLARGLGFLIKINRTQR